VEASSDITVQALGSRLRFTWALGRRGEAGGACWPKALSTPAGSGVAGEGPMFADLPHSVASSGSWLGLASD
jgi:hypothetical protein